MDHHIHCISVCIHSLSLRFLPSKLWMMLGVVCNWTSWSNPKINFVFFFVNLLEDAKINLVSFYQSQVFFFCDFQVIFVRRDLSANSRNFVRGFVARIGLIPPQISREFGPNFEFISKGTLSQGVRFLSWSVMITWSFLNLFLKSIRSCGCKTIAKILFETIVFWDRIFGLKSYFLTLGSPRAHGPRSHRRAWPSAALCWRGAQARSARHGQRAGSGTHRP